MIRLLVLPISLASSLALAQTEYDLHVDATQAPMRLFHGRMEMAAKPGPLTLEYEQWIPGEHMPSGPISNFLSLHTFADGKEIQWRRDLEDMYAFHVEVPNGAKRLAVEYDYAAPPVGGDFGASPSANATGAVLNWYEVTLCPKDLDPAQVTVHATLTIPKGWHHGGSLDVQSDSGATVTYAPVSLQWLNDHPINMGLYFKSFELWPASSKVGEHAIDVIADSAWALDAPQKRIDAYKQLVLEERAVFGGVGHYRKYHWLLALSDNLGGFGVEHHECADDRTGENFLVDDDAAKAGYILLPHEFFHSWNGKALRPAGLLAGGYEKPMHDDLLWVYEGLTNYYGDILGARCGLVTPEWMMEWLAVEAHSVDVPGRTWRPLQDTADAAPFLYAARQQWSGLRRGTDFYAEGSLIWLEADVTIRRLTGGKKSLDDFCTLFHGLGDNGRVFEKPYEFQDVVNALNQVAPYDWAGFFQERLNSKNPHPPVGGVEGAGYRFVYTDKENEVLKAEEGDGADLTASIGAALAADGTVQDCWPGSPAFKAGLGVGMKVIAVDLRKFSKDEIKRVVAASPKGSGPIQLITENSGRYAILNVDYHGGARYPHFERLPGKQDVLSEIAAARIK